MANDAILSKIEHKLSDEADWSFRVGLPERGNALCARAMRVADYRCRMAEVEWKRAMDLEEAMCWDDDADYAL